MITLLASYLEQYFGPMRLFKSYSFLIFLTLYASFLLSLYFLPKFFKRLPVDRGRNFAVENAKAVGKPTGAGVIFISIATLTSFLFTPPGYTQYLIIALTWLTMLSGYLDDRSTTPWSEYRKGLLDLILALAAAAVLSKCQDVVLWFPFTSKLLTVPVYYFIPGAAILIWISINTTNCSDGVDGLSGTLVMIGLVSLGFILYAILSHAQFTSYLLLPHYPEGAKWAVTIFSIVGSLAAYLWFNAYPSEVLMGDAGSRALGFYIGVAVICTGNPFIYFSIATVLFVNGGTGLVKVALLRFLNIRIFHNTRFPLHDHVRENHKWSNTQVLIKFAIIQLMITIGLLGILLKIR